jgi:uncharacterized protein YqcC (DUF446 family)
VPRPPSCLAEWLDLIFLVRLNECLEKLYLLPNFSALLGVTDATNSLMSSKFESFRDHISAILYGLDIKLELSDESTFLKLQ